MDILFWVFIGLFTVCGVLGVLIYLEQKKLEAPPGGILYVDKNDLGKPTIYFQAFDDPAKFKDGQQVLVKIVVFEENRPL